MMGRVHQCYNVLCLSGIATIIGDLLFNKMATKSEGEIIIAMATLLKQIAHSGGFDITIIMDGNIRPERRKEKRLNGINRRKSASSQGANEERMQS